MRGQCELLFFQCMLKIVITIVDVGILVVTTTDDLPSHLSPACRRFVRALLVENPQEVVLVSKYPPTGLTATSQVPPRCIEWLGSSAACVDLWGMPREPQIKRNSRRLASDPSIYRCGYVAPAVNIAYRWALNSPSYPFRQRLPSH